jgi:hypothetical protein
MEPLFGDDVILQRFLQWLNSGPERDDLQMCSALSLGNLARSGTYSFQFFDFSIFKIDLLIKSLHDFFIL